MRKNRSNLTFWPRDLVRFLESPFASWMDRQAVEFPEAAEPDPSDEGSAIVLARGVRHEAAVLARFREEGRDVFEAPGGVEGLAATRDAIRAGREVIYQARLEDARFSGTVDFLIRDIDRPQPFYEPLEAKLARTPRPRDAIQLCCYADMLARIQGDLPKRLHIALGSGEHRMLRTEDLFHYYRFQREAFLRAMAGWDPSRPPVPEPRADHRPWQSHAEALLERLDHPSRVANITRVEIAKLERNGIVTTRGLADSCLDRVPGIRDETWRRLRAQARLQQASAGHDRPHYEVLQPASEGPRRGLALLPPASPGDVFFDLEGWPLAAEPLEYLFGAVALEGREPEFHDWWAHDAAAECNAFVSFVDWLVARRRADPRMHAYHYGHYEPAALKRLMGRHATREREIDDLLRREVFVDLYQVVRAGLVVGTPRYSLKNLERLFREARAGAVGTALDSIVYYQRWLDSGEPGDWQASPILEEIRSYNRDDCDSTRLLAGWLRDRQREQAIAWVDPVSTPEGDEPTAAAAEALEREALASRLATGSRGDSLAALMAQFLEFHRREDRPMWWARFERGAMSEDELVEDVNCLGGLERTGARPVEDGRSLLVDYAFDPEQETKVDTGANCLLAHDPVVEVGVESLDVEAGRVRLRFGPAARARAGEPPSERLSLIPDEYVRAQVITRSIARSAALLADGAPLPGALDDFLQRRPPRIRGHAGGPLVAAGEDPADATVRLTASMDGTTLAIQGPPGSGKTTAAARAIVALLDAGKKVGIASNSHKAILNLMIACARLREWRMACAKVGGPRDSELFARCEGARWVEKNNGAAALLARCPLLGGTAWLFARPEMAGRLDWLFVDEAGQVPAANLVGMAPSARNVVLAGDPLQLPQPVQGAHPGSSGLSSLEYLMDGHATVPAEQGIFLGTTYRLHPELCALISSAFYEDRLAAAPFCARRVVRVPEGSPGLVPREAGVVFVPVEHEGNSQACMEEVDAIERVIRDLVGRERTGAEGRVAGPLVHGDILVVAPYNLQVRKLQQRLPPAVRVGTVDRFQGQQAPVVILSLCSSDGSGASRGLEFLLNPNRLNVALSRAESLAVVVGHPGLAATRCATFEQLTLVNRLCRLVAAGSTKKGDRSI